MIPQVIAVLAPTVNCLQLVPQLIKPIPQKKSKIYHFILYY